jgi:hypothetical protein
MFNIKAKLLPPAFSPLPVVHSLDVLDKGVISYRNWALKDNKLCSLSSDTEWGRKLYADEKPSSDNTNGIYSYKLRNHMLVCETCGEQKYIGEEDVFGFIDCRGHIVEHSDGVIRSEYAEIIKLFYSHPPSYDSVLLSEVRGEAISSLWSFKRIVCENFLNINLLHDRNLYDWQRELLNIVISFLNLSVLPVRVIVGKFFPSFLNKKIVKYWIKCWNEEQKDIEDKFKVLKGLEPSVQMVLSDDFRTYLEELCSSIVG